MIIVTGSVTARADSFKALLEASLEHVRRSRTEEGCISHAVHADCENPLRLFFYERWADLEKLKAHVRQPGSLEFVAHARELADASETITLYQAETVETARIRS